MSAKFKKNPNTPPPTKKPQTLLPAIQVVKYAILRQCKLSASQTQKSSKKVCGKKQQEKQTLETESLVRWWGLKRAQSSRSYGNTDECKDISVSTCPYTAAFFTPCSSGLDGQPPHRLLTKCSRLTHMLFSGNIILKVCPFSLLFSLGEIFASFKWRIWNWLYIWQINHPSYEAWAGKNGAG